jgi:RNase P subunit RPR2
MSERHSIFAPFTGDEKNSSGNNVGNHADCATRPSIFAPAPDDGWRPTLLAKSLPDSFRVGPCPNCQGPLSMKDFKESSVEENERLALFHCTNCNSDVTPVVTVEAYRPRRSHKRRAPLPDPKENSIQSRNTTFQSIARHVKCPRWLECDGVLCPRKPAERRCRADGLFQPVCSKCGEEIDLAVMMRLFLKDQNFANTTPESLRLAVDLLHSIEGSDGAGIPNVSSSGLRE